MEIGDIYITTNNDNCKIKKYIDKETSYFQYLNISPKKIIDYLNNFDITLYEYCLLELQTSQSNFKEVKEHELLDYSKIIESEPLREIKLPYKIENDSKVFELFKEQLFKYFFTISYEYESIYPINNVPSLDYHVDVLYKNREDFYEVYKYLNTRVFRHVKLSTYLGVQLFYTIYRENTFFRIDKNINYTDMVNELIKTGTTLDETIQSLIENIPGEEYDLDMQARLILSHNPSLPLNKFNIYNYVLDDIISNL